MRIMDKIKELARVSEEEYIDEVEEQGYEDYEEEYEEYEQEPQQETRPVRETAYNRKHVSYQPADQEKARVVDISSGRARIVFKQITEYEECAEVTDLFGDNNIVIFNLETCSTDLCRRVLDVLYGASYANHGKIKRIAARSYVLIPSVVQVHGPFLDEIQNEESAL